MVRNHLAKFSFLALTLLVVAAIPAHGQSLWTDLGNGIIDTDNSISIGDDSQTARIYVNPNSLRFNLRNQTSGPMVIDYGSLFNFRQGVGGPSTMFFDLSGNVGIQTTIPQSELAVNGTITAREVVVTQDGWPDYVFDDDYALMPLGALEARIQEDGHLPGIPSAQEAAENGVGVGEMQAKLLEKVEELTLYMIALQKENDNLKSRLDNIEGSK